MDYDRIIFFHFFYAPYYIYMQIYLYIDVYIYINLQHDPMTMVVLATGPQVHCILCEQETIFKKGIGFLCGLKLFALDIFCEEYNKSMFDVANMIKGKLCQRYINK